MHSVIFDPKKPWKYSSVFFFPAVLYVVAVYNILPVFADLPPMILTEEGKDYSAVEGKGVMMHCNVFSSPPSTINW